MKKFTTSQRLKQLMNERNIKQVDILIKAEPFCKKYGVKLNKNDLSQYVNGKVEPGQQKLSILGLALNVNEAWLMGYDVPQIRDITFGNETVEELSAKYDNIKPIKLKRFPMLGEIACGEPVFADEDKEEALPLVRRFYELGFNIEATVGTGVFLKEHGIRTRIRGKLSDGSDEILRSIRSGYVSYIINTRAILSGIHYNDGVEIRRCAIMNGVTMFTSLDTVRILLDVLEDISPRISVIG